MRSASAPSYLRAWLANPFGFGAVAPSGPALAALITSEISVDSGRVLELGSGKGALTHAILDRGVAESDLVLIERRPDFAAVLRQRFPAAHVESMDADLIGNLNPLFHENPPGAVVSGLPLLTLPADKVTAILSAAFDLLRSDGAFYQFTYGPKAPVREHQLRALGLTASKVGRAFLNIPPAAVYRISRS